MKKFLTLSLLIGTTLVSGAVVFAQSLPTLDTAANMVTISQPYQASQCIEPDGTQVYLTKHFYFGDTYTTRDFVPKRGSNYDTLLLNNGRVLVFNPSLFNWGSSPIKWKSNGVPDSLSVPYIVATSGTFQVASTSP